MSVVNGVCTLCGSGVLESGEHVRQNLLPCAELLDPLNAEFWWHNHERFVREGKLDTPFPRNPNDIDTALRMTPGGLEAIREAHAAGQRYRNIGQYEAGYEIVINTVIARLMDAGVLVRPHAEIH